MINIWIRWIWIVTKDIVACGKLTTAVNINHTIFDGCNNNVARSNIHISIICYQVCFPLSVSCVFLFLLFFFYIVMRFSFNSDALLTIQNKLVAEYTRYVMHYTISERQMITCFQITKSCILPLREWHNQERIICQAAKQPTNV